MPRSSKLQLSPTALTFTAGVLTGLVIGVFAGYAARGLMTDDHERDRVEQHDIWDPYGTRAPIEAPLDVDSEAPRSPLDLDDWAHDDAPSPPAGRVGNPDATRDANATPEHDTQDQELGATTEASADHNADASTNTPSPLGLALDDDPSPANPTIENVKPGGLRVAEDPDASYDAPAP